MHSIRTKIIGVSLAAILAGMMSVFLVCLYSIQVENDLSSVEMMNLLATDTAKSLAKYFNSVEQSVEMAANIASDSIDSVALVEGGVAGTYATQHERTKEQVRELDSYLAKHSAATQVAFSSVASHTYGVLTYYYCICPEISETEHGFFYSKVGKSGFGEREPLDARTLDPEDTEHTTWYYTPIKRGRPSWVGPYTAHFLNEMRICSYLVPIYKAGALIGVLGMDIPLDLLIEQIQAIHVYETGFACLLDEEGRIVYHPSLEEGTVPSIPGLSTHSGLFAQESSGDKVVRYRLQDQERQLAFSKLPNGMTLVITAPVDEISESWVRLTHIIAVTILLASILYALVIFFLMRAITRPLQDLTVASERLAGGDYNVSLEYKSRDEIGKLTSSFIKMRDQQKAYIADLNRRVYTDDLTGLPNMRHFFKLAEEGRRRITEEGGSPAFLYFNLIGLKHFNRQYGFEEGDRLLREIADILAARYGNSAVGRISQDHFVAVTDEKSLAEELPAVFQEFREANGGVSLPVHAGIYPNRLGEVDIDASCDRAKYACDLQRGTFVSGYVFFDVTMMNRVENIRYVINSLDEAIDKGWIRVFYQPIVRAPDGTLCDEEALSRWVDPHMGFMSPGEFIPILEDARLICKLDLYVLDQILKKLAMQQAAGLNSVPQSLNLSRSDFDACDIVEEIRRRVDDAGIPRQLLTIEVTESIVGSDFDFMKEQIERFQALGFQVWMDDFGSGYSSLDMLQDIHFDLIKLDMRFMQRFDAGEKNRIILTELIRLASSLGSETITEGVEHEEQVRFLREIGCTKLQGYYFGKPQPLGEAL